MSPRVSHATEYVHLGGRRADIEARLDQLGWAWSKPMSLLLDEALIIEERGQ